jgi:hypothetical protein
MQQFMESAIIGQAAVQFANVYATAWRDGLMQPYDGYDAFSFDKFAYDFEFLCPPGHDVSGFYKFLQVNSILTHDLKHFSRTTDEYYHFGIGYLSRSDEGARCIHGIALVVPAVIDIWDRITAEDEFVSAGLTVRRCKPEEDRFARWKRLAYGIALSAMLGRHSTPQFTAFGPMVPGSALHFRGVQHVWAELRNPDRLAEVA